MDLAFKSERTNGGNRGSFSECGLTFEELMLDHFMLTPKDSTARRAAGFRYLRIRHTCRATAAEERPSFLPYRRACLNDTGFAARFATALCNTTKQRIWRY